MWYWYHTCRNLNLRLDPIPLLLDSSEPWVQYNTLVNILDKPTDDQEVANARSELLSHPKIQSLIREC